MFVRASQSVNWELKSLGEAKTPPGMKEDPNLLFLGSTMPLYFRSFGGSTSVVTKVLVNAATPSARHASRPMPGSLSQNSRLGIAPSWPSNSHVPISRSTVSRVGLIRTVTYRGEAAVISSTGSSRYEPSTNIVFCGGNHRSHCTKSSCSQTSRPPEIWRKLLHVLAEQFHRPRPTDSLSDNRCRRLQFPLQGRPNPSL